MKVCVAQTRPITGDIPGNIVQHKKILTLAVAHGADLVIFPELSLTGYEPELATALATHHDAARLDDFQTFADTNQITIGIGVPTPTTQKSCISTVLFQPHQARQVYSKQYLHSDEEPFFSRGASSPGTFGCNPTIALAICYELSVPEHAKNAFRRGADVYIASVAKSMSGVEQASRRLAEVARTCSMTVLMANCVGHCGEFECGGQSAIWNHHGEVVGQLDAIHEGILMIDTVTQATFQETVSK